MGTTAATDEPAFSFFGARQERSAKLARRRRPAPLARSVKLAAYDARNAQLIASRVDTNSVLFLASDMLASNLALAFAQRSHRLLFAFRHSNLQLKGRRRRHPCQPLTPLYTSAIIAHATKGGKMDSEIVDTETGEVVEGALVPQAEPDRSLATYRGAGMAPITKEEDAKLGAPTPPELLAFRWGDKAKTYALAYVPQVHYRRLLNSTLGRGQWALVPLSSPKVVDNTVVYHGALYIRGCFIGEACGEHEYNESNSNTSWPTSLESARSDCLTRICKDLGIFSECWDKTWTEPYEVAWKKEQQVKCPRCSKVEWVNQDRDDKTRYYCWRNPARGKDGCGWDSSKDGWLDQEPPAAVKALVVPAGPVSGVLAPPPTPTPPAAPQAPRSPARAPRKPARATAAGPSVPAGESPVTGETKARFQELITKLCRFEEVHGSDGKQKLSVQILNFVIENPTEKAHYACVRRMEKEIAAREALGQDGDDLSWLDKKDGVSDEPERGEY
jgi:hypothetical protein